jgi:ABC-type multidrug transport system fused ATPase/permease subunit
MRAVRLIVRDSPRLLIVGVVTAAGQTALLIPIALVVSSLFDHQLKQHKEGAIVASGLAILALYSVSALLEYFSRRIVVNMASGMGARLRDQLITKLQALPQAWLDRQRAGIVHPLIVQDSERVERMLSDLANPVLPAALIASALAVVALVISPVLFLALVAVLPVTVIAHFLGRRTRSRTRAWAAAGRSFAAEVHRALRAATLTKVHAAEAEQAERARRPARELAQATRVVGAARAAYTGVTSALGAVAGAVVLIVGGMAVARDAISLGDLLAFYAVLALLLRHLQVATSSGQDVTIGLESLGRIEEFLATPDEAPYPNGRETIPFGGEVTLENVTFAYAAVPVLQHVSLRIGAGERVAIVGPNGAGKSTLVSILMGLYRPQGGRVLADGVPFEQLDMGVFRRQLGVVQQDPLVFPGTIRENIAFGRPEASDADIRAAAETATARHFVERFPAGYDTVVGDEGVGLSGGQRQRIAIARALLDEPRLLLLDEPTTYLDESGVTALLENLANLPRRPTIVLATHDPQASTHADRVIALRDGRVVSDSRRVAEPVDA